MVSTLSAILLFFSCVKAKDVSYTASTPANDIVRSFFNISNTDSIDFIRWNLSLLDDSFHLNCQYGISKPNTNGFIDGKTIHMNGAVKREANKISIHHGHKILKLVELNSNLLLLVNEKDQAMVGNAGWSYTLNKLAGAKEESSLSVPVISFTDSVKFEGRTPCNVPGIIAEGQECYKIKWQIVFFKTAGENSEGNYRIKGTPFRNYESKSGRWLLEKAQNGRRVYVLYNEKQQPFIHLLPIDNNVMVFTDSDIKLLVGNEDFSYTMNLVKW